MTHLCRCSHEYTDHLTGVGLEACTHRACGCDEYRLDPRSLVCGEDETAATGAFDLEAS